jgi:CDP-diacylglycerol--glycerol-3-phosphate 3-phosphatidyltransferase
MAGSVFLNEKTRERYLRIVGPIGNGFARAGIHPHVMTAAGLILSLLSGLAYANGSFFWGGWVLALAGTCDVLDGMIARQGGKESLFGAFLDSTLDRFSDSLPMMGLACYFSGGRFWTGLMEGAPPERAEPWTVLVIMLAIIGSFMVSYTRARAEGIGVECRKGFMQRPERITLLVIGSLLGAIPWAGVLLLKCSLFLLAVSTNLTALQRMLLVKRHFRKEREGE